MDNISDKIKSVYKKLTFSQVLVFGYLLLVLVGAAVLTLPVSARDGIHTPYFECVFITTSTFSGTGLTLYDTYSHWSFFGQVVLLIVMQIGGIGFMSITLFMLSYTNKKIGLKSRVTMRESVSGISGGGVIKMTRFILKGTIIIELIGTALLCEFYVPRLGVGMGIFFALFHSVSAVCTAGLDLMGYFEPGSSLITAQSEVMLNVTLIILLTIGGLGFITWHDIVEHKFKFKKYRLQSKLVILITIIFYFAGLGLTLLFEWKDSLIEHSTGDKFLIMSMLVTSGRDAGFAPILISSLRPATILVIIVFMFVGGAPGSTACGIKTTTFAVMLLTITSVFRKRKSVECFGRRIDEGTVRNACCITTLYLIVVITGTMIISAVDGIEITSVVFETVSAISACGLSMGITSSLSFPSQLIITLIMFFGRVGGITFIVSLKSDSFHAKSQLPEEKIMVG